MNKCGECKICCSVLKIDDQDLIKDANKVCPNLNEYGCSIYKDRPETCRIYKCMWLQVEEKISGFRKVWRPDNLGLLVSTQYKEEHDEFHFRIEEVEPDTFNIDELGEFLDMVFVLANQQKGNPLVAIRYFGTDEWKEVRPAP